MKAGEQSTSIREARRNGGGARFKGLLVRLEVAYNGCDVKVLHSGRHIGVCRDEAEERFRASGELTLPERNGRRNVLRVFSFLLLRA